MTKVPPLRGSARSDLFWSMLGYGIYMISQVGIMMSMARLAPVEDVGRYGFAISLTTVVIVLCNLGLRVGHATDVVGEDRMGVYVATRILSTSVAFFAITLIVFFVADGPTIPIVMLVAVAKCGEAMSDLFYGSFQKAGQLKHLAVSMLLRGPISLAIFYLLLATTDALNLALLSQAVTWWAVAIGHDFLRANHMESCIPRFHWRQIWALSCETFPLGLAGLFTSIATNAPRVIVAAQLGLMLAGIYTAVGFVLQMGTIFANSVSHAMSNRLARAFQEGRTSAYIKITVKFAGLMFFVGIIGLLLCIFWARPILTMAFGPSYAEYGPLFSLMLANLTVRMPIAALQTAVVAQRSFRAFAVLRAAVAIGIIAGAWIGAVAAGLNGIAVAILFVSLVQISVLVVLLRRGLRTIPSFTPNH